MVPSAIHAMTVLTGVIELVGGIAHQDALLNCWAIFIFPNLYFLVKITHSMDAEAGRMGAETGRMRGTQGMGNWNNSKRRRVAAVKALIQSAGEAVGGVFPRARRTLRVIRWHCRMRGKLVVVASGRFI